MQPNDLISKHFRLVPAQATALRRLGINTLEDLLRHFPARYETAGSSTSVRALVPGMKVTLFGKLSGLKAKKLWKSKRNATEGFFEDSSGRVKVMWFNQPYMASYVSEGSMVKVTGTVGGSVEKPYITNPEVEKVSAEIAMSADTRTLQRSRYARRDDTCTLRGLSGDLRHHLALAAPRDRAALQSRHGACAH